MQHKQNKFQSKTIRYVYDLEADLFECASALVLCAHTTRFRGKKIYRLLE